MTPPTRRPAPRKRSATKPTLQQALHAGKQRGATDKAVGNGPNASESTEVSANLIVRFQGLLDEEEGIDRGIRDYLEEKFKQVLDSAADSGESLSTLPERSTWLSAIEGLKETGSLNEAEVIDLERRLEEALQPFQSRESKLAFEFSRRLSSEGEAAAIEWLRTETKKSEAEKAEKPEILASSPTIKRTRSEVTNSRSRRLRGPPSDR